MRNHSPTLRKCFLILPSVLLLAANSFAHDKGLSIGLNFGADDNGAALGLAPTDVAGVAPQANWNNLNGASGNAAALLSDSKGLGSPTAVSVTWTSPNTWSSTGRGEENNGFPAGGDRTMMTGYIDTSDQAAGAATVTISGLPPEFTVTGYDVIVYALGGVAGRGGAYSIGTVTNFGTGPVSPTEHALDAGVDHNDTGTYMRFSGLSGSSFTLIANAEAGVGFGTTRRAPVNGIQIVSRGQGLTLAQLGRNRVGSLTDNGGGSFSIIGGGNDIWDNHDEFTYAYTEVTGDFDVKVRVESLERPAQWTKAGLMVRETLAEDSRMVFNRVTPTDGDNNTRFAYRTGRHEPTSAFGDDHNGGRHEDIDAANTIGGANLPNGWLRLSRVGSVFTAYNSTDGVTWQLVSSQDTATGDWVASPNSPAKFANTVLLGLGVSRHSGANTAAAEFRDFSLSLGAAGDFNVIGASSRGNPTGIRVEFNHPTGLGALDPINYNLTASGGPLVTVVTGLRFTTANDAPARDPMTFTLEGTVNDPATGPWTLIASGNTGLDPVARLATAPDVTFANSTPYRSYRILFPTVRDAAAANSMQIAEVAFLDANGNDVTAPGDAVIPSSANSPGSGNENAPMAIDDNNSTKYLNFDKLNTGFVVTPTAGSTPSASIVSAVQGPNPSTVQLTTTPLVEGVTYNLEVAFNVQDSAGQELATTSASFVHGEGYEARRIRLARNMISRDADVALYRSTLAYELDIPTANHGLPAVASNSLFEDVTPSTGDGQQENFSVRISGVLNITTSGDYTFYHSSDDEGILYLSSDEDPANKVAIAREPAWNGGREYISGGNQASRGTPPANISAPINLQAGRKYYLELIFSEGGGGNNGSATWQVPGGPAVANGTLPIPESAFTPSRMFRGSSFQSLGPVQIVQQPATQTITALTPAVFKVKVDGTPAYTYQWRRNGVPIAGANGQSYTIPIALPSDDGSVFSVVVANEFSTVTSGNAVLTVNNPQPPHLLSATGDNSFTKIFVNFDNRLDPASAQEPFNYSVPGLTVQSAVLDASGRTVVLTTSPQTQGTTYNVTVSDVKEQTGVNVLDPNPSTAVYTSFAFAPGYALKETYLNYTAGVDALINDAARLANPNASCLTNLWEFNSADSADNYGGRIRAYFIPQQTGPHRFFIASDDPGRLFLSTDENPANKTLIAREPIWASRRNWTGANDGSSDGGVRGGCDGEFCENVSGFIDLVAGQRYYIESYFTEGGGGDHMAVAVQGPNDPVPADGSTPITSGYFGNYVSIVGASVAINTQPVSQQVTDNAQVTFSVGATGSSPLCGGTLSYQWRKNGIDIPNANSSTLVLPQVTLADDGSLFSVAVRVPGIEQVSANALLNVSTDNVPPAIASAKGGSDLASVTVVYSELVDGGNAGDVFSYGIVDSGGGALGILTATLQPDGRTVILTTDPQAENTVYTVTATGIFDLVGNEIVNNTGNFTSYVLGGGILFEAFPGIGGVAVNDLTGNASYPNSPTDVAIIGAFNSRLVYADDSHDNYGARMRGLFIPPTSGPWVFYLAADDGSRLLFNPAGPNAAGAQVLLERTACCGDYNSAASKSAPQTLQAGQGYFIEVLYKEGGGGDWAQVAARPDGQPTPPLSEVIPGSQLGYPAAPPGIGGPVIITQQPVDVSVSENVTFTFTVAAQNPNSLPLSYQWRKNGVDIPGANKPTYSALGTSADNGAVFTVRVSVIGDRVISAGATLTVIVDNEPPLLVSARGNEFFDKVTVVFNELVGAGSEDNFNYSISGGISVTTAVKQPDGKSVVLTLGSKLLEGTDYTVTVSDVYDLAATPNLIAPGSTVTFRSHVFAAGFLNFSSFFNFGGADLASMDAMIASPRYPDQPDERGYMTAFDSRTIYPTDIHENYGARITGVFVPPTSGNWIFYLKSDDSSRLFLNPTGTDPAGRILLTEEAACCGQFEGHASAPQALTAGQRYYIEGIYKEGGGGDYMQVAAKLDTDPTPPNSLPVIPPDWLGTYVDTTGVSVTITQQPVDTTHVIDPMAPGSNPTSTLTVVATGTFPPNPAQPIIYRWQRDNGTGFVDVVGGNGPSLVLAPSLADNGARFRVIVGLPGDVETSSEVTLTVIQLNTAPKFTAGGNQTVAEDSGPQSVPGWATDISPHSIVRVPIVYGSDFNSLPPGASLAGSAAVAGGVLHLTDAINGQSGQFFTPAAAGSRIESFTLDFNLRIGGGTCCGAAIPEGTSRMADGLSVNFGNDLGAGFGEEGTGTGLLISFDLWDNGEAGAQDASFTAPNIDVRLGGTATPTLGYQALDGEREGGRAPSGPFVTDPATGAPMKLITGDAFAPVRINLDTDGTIDVFYKNVQVINNLATTYQPILSPRIGIGARTGGANANQWVDNLQLTAYPADSSSVEAGQTVSFITTVDQPSLFSVAPAVASDGTLTYTPAPNACGLATVTVVAKDNGGVAAGGQDTSAPQTFTIEIQCVNDCPTTSPLSLTVASGGTVTFQLPASDVDGDALQYIVSQPALHGTVIVQEGTGSGTYTPNPGYSGPDSFRFEARDGDAQCVPQSSLVSITVTSGNLPPTARIEIIPTADFSPAITNKILIAGDGQTACAMLDGSLSSDPESATSELTFQWFLDTPPVLIGGSMVVSNYCFELGTHTILLIVTDPQGATGMETVTIDVISAGEAIEELINRVNDSSISRKNKRPFIASLKAAAASADRGQTHTTVNQLNAFLNKVRAQVSRDNPEEAAIWSRMAQAIIDALNRAE